MLYKAKISGDSLQDHWSSGYHFRSVFLNLYNNSDQTWFCHSLTYARSLRKVENIGLRLGFQHFPWDLANVNEWKSMFDPSNIVKKKTSKENNTITQCT